jgi:predicted MFS family arabinose efflux permease
VTTGLDRPRLVSRALGCVFVASLGGMTGFFLLLSVVPLYATGGGAGEAGAGATTAALLLSTVAAELVTPRLVARFGHRLMFGTGLLLLGAPALALAYSDHLAAIVSVSAVRGLGFGVVVVLGSALVASLVPAGRRGEGLGLFGVVIGVPAVLALPFGVYLVGQAGYPPVLIAGGLAALAGMVVLPGLPGRQPPPAGPVGILTAARAPALLRPAVVFAAVAMAGGVVVTFVPLAVIGASPTLVFFALLVQATMTALARWSAGWYADRRGAAGLVVPALLAAAGGILILVLVASPVAVLAGMALFGLGFGASQNASLVLMFSRVPGARYGAVSALWNVAFDAGMGLGAIGFGVVVAQTGYPWAFALTGAVMLAALVPARRDRAAAGAGPAPERGDRAGTS